MKKAVIAIAAFATLFGVAQIASADDGKAVYEKACQSCHKAGVMKAPKTGDAAACEAMNKAGAATLTASVIKGKSIMKPKGGAATDDDAKAAVEYMLAQCK